MVRTHSWFWQLLGGVGAVVFILLRSACADDTQLPDLLSAGPEAPVVNYEKNWQWPAAYRGEGQTAGDGAGGAEELPAFELNGPADGATDGAADGTQKKDDGKLRYDSDESALTWLPGGNDQFGWFSYDSSTVTNIVAGTTGVITGFGVSFLNGPVQTDMPPRLFQFLIGVQDRRHLNDDMGYDINFHVGVFSDFEGSAQKGVRFPGHAVTFWQMTPEWELLLGVEYLDRDDISALPVAGWVWTPSGDMRLEAVFPRPRVAWRMNDSERWLYVGGELGGDTWAIERADRTNDNATYRDLRLTLGIESLGTVGDILISSSCEIGYVFDRRLSYRSGVGDYSPADGWMLRLVSRY